MTELCSYLAYKPEQYSYEDWLRLINKKPKDQSYDTYLKILQNKNPNINTDEWLDLHFDTSINQI